MNLYQSSGNKTVQPQQETAKNQPTNPSSLGVGKRRLTCRPIKSIQLFFALLMVGLLGVVGEVQGQTSSFTTTGGTNTGNVTEACSPTTMYFTDTSTGATSWNWDFGNSNSVTTSDPVVAHSQSANYPQPGTYTVTLTINGGTGAMVSTQTIKVYPKPSPAISGTQIGCAPFSTTLTATATPVVVSPFSIGSSSVGGITGGAASTYTWDFFGAIATVGPTISPTLNLTNVATGTYNLLLTVTDVHGCSKSALFLSAITVNPTPTADFSFVKTCGTLDVAFSGTSAISSGTITSYAWDIENNGSVESMLQNYNYTFPAAGSKDVSFRAISAANCASTPVVKTVVFNSGNAVGFSSTGTCVNQPVAFTDASTNVSSRVWDFGDGTTSTSVSPSHTYSSTGSKTVKLTATFSDGCTSEVTHNVTITGAASAFTYSTSSSCSPNYAINFTSTSVPSSGTITSYGWDFNNDGTIDVTTLTGFPTTSYNFLSPGTKSVGLTVTTSDGCSNKVVSNVVVPAASTVDFSATPLNGCIPLNSTFTAIYDGGSGTVSGYSWNFGDPASGVNNTSTLPSPSHNYTIAGKYNVSLTITTSNGCTLTATKTGYIAAGSPQTITLVTGSAAGYCLTNSITYTATITNLTDQLDWDFGDGTDIQFPSNETSSLISHSFDSPGLKTVTAIAWYNGCPSATYTNNAITVQEPTAAFTNSPATKCDIPKTVNFTSTGTGATSYAWDFGDPTYSSGGNPNTSTANNPSHIYTVAGDYVVTLTVNNSTTGCSAVTTTTIYVTTSVPEFTVNNTVVCAGTASTFTNDVAAHSSANFTVSSYLWTFGDGQTSTQPNPSHTYSTPGLYNVTLQVTGTHGCVYSSLPTQIDVHGPIVDFTTGAAQICSGQAVTFTDATTKASNDPATSNTWYWTFGDGGTSTLQSPSHTYAGSGDYTVTLQVTDNLGCVRSKSVTNSVIVPNILAGFTTTRSTYCADAVTPVAFTNSATVSSGSISKYEYDLADGNGYVTKLITDVVSRTFPAVGTYTIKQKITSNLGCTAEFSKVITVVDGTGEISISSVNLGCAPAFGLFTPVDANDPSVIQSYLWNFGDGQTSTERSPNHYFLRPGTYTVRLTETLTGGCTKTTTKVITVAGAIGTFTYDNTPGCAPHFENYFAAGLSSVTSLTWDFGDGVTQNMTVATGVTSKTTDHTYTTWGSRLPILILRDPVCGDYAYYYGVDQRINTSEPPIALFDFSTVLGTGLDCQNLNIQFTDKSTKGNDPRYSVSTWDWNFGDGSAHSFIQNPTHIYTSAGTKTATLTVTNGFLAGPPLACPASIPKDITVNPIPVVTATNQTQIICSGASSSAMVLSSALAGSTFNWTRDTPAGITPVTPSSGTGVAIGGSISGVVFTNSTSAPIIVTYTITPIGPGPTFCEGAAITATVTINPIPVAVATPSSQTICHNSNSTAIVLTSAVTGTTFDWTRTDPGLGTVTTTMAASGTGVASGGSIPVSSFTNTSGSDQTFTITITPKGPGSTACTGTPITATILVRHDPPTPADPTGPTQVCYNSSGNVYSATVIAGYTYNWDISNGTINSGEGTSSVSVTWNSATTPHQIRYRYQNNGCNGPFSGYLAVTVDPLPAATATNQTQIICSGTSSADMVLGTSNSVTGTTFAWSRNENAGITTTQPTSGTGVAIGGVIPLAAFTNTTYAPITITYTITPTGPAPTNCVGANITATVTINPLPNTTVTNPAQSICSGSSSANKVLGSSVTGTTFAWTRDTPAGITTSQPTSGTAVAIGGNIPGYSFTNSTSAPVTVTYTITPTGPASTNCGGSPATVTATVIVNPIPDATATNQTQAICSATSSAAMVLSSAVTGTTFNWTRNTPANITSGSPTSGTGVAIGGTIDAATFTNTSSAPITITYTITPYGPASTNCPGSPITATVTVNPRPTVTSASSMSICSGSSTGDYAPTSGVTGTTFTWTAANTIGTVTGYSLTGSGNINETLTNTGSGNGQVTYTITPHNTTLTPSCDGPAFELKVDVINCTPKIGVAKQLVSLDNNGNGTYDALFNIRVQNYGNVVLNNVQVTEDLTTTFGAANYTVLGLSSTAFDVNTSFTGVGSLLDNTGTTNILAVGASTDIRLRVRILSIGSYNNSVTASSSTAGTVPDVSQNGSDPDPDGDGNPGNNNVVTPVSTSCVAPVVNAGPATATICKNSTYIISGATASNYGTITWSVSAGTVTGTFDNTHALNPLFTPSAGETGTATLLLTATNVNSSCSNVSDNIVLTVSSLPTVDAGAVVNICSSSVAAIALNDATEANTGTYQWTTSGTGTFTNSTSLTTATYTLSAADKLSGQVQLTLTASGSCGSVSDIKVINISPSPTFNAGPDAAICAGSSFTLTGARATNYASVAWTSSGSGSFNNASALNPIYTPSGGDITAGSVTLTLTPTQIGSGCTIVPDAMVLTINATPTLTLGTVTNTNCNASVGSVVLTSSVAGSVSLNGGAGVALVASTAKTISSLAAGYYTAVFTATT